MEKPWELQWKEGGIWFGRNPQRGLLEFLFQSGVEGLEKGEKSSYSVFFLHAAFNKINFYSVLLMSLLKPAEYLKSTFYPIKSHPISQFLSEKNRASSNTYFPRPCQIFGLNFRIFLEN